MSLWVSLLVGALILIVALLGLLLLLAALFHVRGDVAWLGMWTGGAALPHETSVRIEYGFPGFMRAWAHEPLPGEAPDARTHAQSSAANAAEAPSTPFADAATPSSPASARPSPSSSPSSHSASPESRAADETSESSGESKTSAATPGAPASAASHAPPRSPRYGTAARQGAGTASRTAKKNRDPHRFRKALFHFVTDGTAWIVLSGYGLRVLLRAARLPRARIDLSAGHPDPAFLGRMAGRWYAVSPLLPPGRVTMSFRFQDRHPSFGVRVRGGFSLLGLLWFCVTSLLTFPLVRLGRRGWHGWRNRALTGWRGRLYRKIQTIDV